MLCCCWLTARCRRVVGSSAVAMLGSLVCSSMRYSRMCCCPYSVATFRRGLGLSSSVGYFCMICWSRGRWPYCMVRCWGVVLFSILAFFCSSSRVPSIHWCCMARCRAVVFCWLGF